MYKNLQTLFLWLSNKGDVLIMMNQKIKTKQITLMGLFIAMCVVGGMIKIPNIASNSIAFDSLSAFLGTLILGGVPGMILGFLGHMASAAAGGFYLTIPIHILVAVQMSLIMIVFNFVFKKFNLIIAIIVGIILNGIISPAMFILIPGYGNAFFITSVVPLLLASAINIILAGITYKLLKKAKVI